MMKRTRRQTIAEAPLNRTTVKVFGQPRSGAGAVERILHELGCDVRGDIGGWKHGPAGMCADLAVIVEKNPYAWSASMKRHVPGPGEPVWGIAGWVERANAGREFVRSHPGRAMLATHEEMVDDWDGLVERLARFAGHADPEHATVAPELRGEVAAVYRAHLYMDELTPNEIRAIRAELRGEVAAVYGGDPPQPVRKAAAESAAGEDLP